MCLGLSRTARPGTTATRPAEEWLACDEMRPEQTDFVIGRAGERGSYLHRSKTAVFPPSSTTLHILPPRLFLPNPPFFLAHRVIPRSFTVITSLHFYNPSVCVSLRSFPLLLQPRRWHLPRPAPWVLLLVQGCRVRTKVVNGVALSRTDCLRRWRLQNHCGLHSRFLGVKAVHLHCPDILCSRRCRSRKSVPCR